MSKNPTKAQRWGTQSGNHTTENMVAIYQREYSGMQQKMLRLEKENARLQALTDERIKTGLALATDELMNGEALQIAYQGGYREALIYLIDIKERYEKPLYMQVTITEAILSQVKGILCLYPDGLPRRSELIDIFAALAKALGDQLNKLEILDRMYRAALDPFIQIEEGETAIDVFKAQEFRKHILNFVAGGEPNDPGGSKLYEFISDNELLITVMDYARALKSRDRRRDDKTLMLANSYAAFKRDNPNRSWKWHAQQAIEDTQHVVAIDTVRVYYAKIRDSGNLTPVYYHMPEPKPIRDTLS